MKREEGAAATQERYHNREGFLERKIERAASKIAESFGHQKEEEEIKGSNRGSCPGLTSSNKEKLIQGSQKHQQIKGFVNEHRMESRAFLLPWSKQLVAADVRKHNLRIKSVEGTCHHSPVKTRPSILVIIITLTHQIFPLHVRLSQLNNVYSLRSKLQITCIFSFSRCISRYKIYLIKSKQPVIWDGESSTRIHHIILQRIMDPTIRPG